MAPVYKYFQLMCGAILLSVEYSLKIQLELFHRNWQAVQAVHMLRAKLCKNKQSSVKIQTEVISNIPMISIYFTSVNLWVTYKQLRLNSKRTH